MKRSLIGIGAPVAVRVNKYDGPVIFALGVFIAGLIAEGILFRAKKPRAEPRGFPVQPIEQTSRSDSNEVR